MKLVRLDFHRYKWDIQRGIRCITTTEAAFAGWLLFLRAKICNHLESNPGLQILSHFNSINCVLLLHSLSCTCRMLGGMLMFVMDFSCTCFYTYMTQFMLKTNTCISNLKSVLDGERLTFWLHIEKNVSNLSKLKVWNNSPTLMVTSAVCCRRVVLRRF